MSDSQVVHSQAVIPALAFPVSSKRPIPDPRTTILLDPDTATLLRFAELTTTRSTLWPSDELPDRPPEVSTARLLPAAPPLAMHRILESDCHPDASQALRPSLTAEQIVLSPKLDPCTVTLVTPVPPRFLLRITLTLSKSTLSPPVTLPACRMTVIATRSLPAVACTT